MNTGQEFENLKTRLADISKHGENITSDTLETLLCQFSTLIKGKTPLYAPATYGNLSGNPLDHPRLPTDTNGPKLRGTFINVIGGDTFSKRSQKPQDETYLWVSFSYKTDQQNMQHPVFDDLVVFNSQGKIINSYNRVFPFDLNRLRKCSPQDDIDLIPEMIEFVISQHESGLFSASPSIKIPVHINFTHVCLSKGSLPFVLLLVTGLGKNGVGFWFNLEFNMGEMTIPTKGEKLRTYYLGKPIHTKSSMPHHPTPENPPKKNDDIPITKKRSKKSSKEVFCKDYDPPAKKIKPLPTKKQTRKLPQDDNINKPEEAVKTTQPEPISKVRTLRPKTTKKNSETSLHDKGSLIVWLRNNSQRRPNISKMTAQDAEHFVQHLISGDSSYDVSYASLGYTTKLSLLLGQNCRVQKKNYKLSKPHIDQEVWEILSDIQ